MMLPIVALMSSCEKDEDKGPGFDTAQKITATVDGVAFEQYAEAAIEGDFVVIKKRITNNDPYPAITLYLPANAYDASIGHTGIYEMDYYLTNPDAATCYAIYTDAEGNQFYSNNGYIDLNGGGQSIEEGISTTHIIDADLEFNAGGHLVTDGSFDVKYTKVL
jgi:hypothetical protein